MLLNRNEKCWKTWILLKYIYKYIVTFSKVFFHIIIFNSLIMGLISSTTIIFSLKTKQTSLVRKRIYKADIFLGPPKVKSIKRKVSRGNTD